MNRKILIFQTKHGIFFNNRKMTAYILILACPRRIIQMTDISRTSFSARSNCRSFKNTFVIKKIRAILNAKKAWRHLRRTILLGSQYILTRLGQFGQKKCGAIFVYEYGQRYSKKAFVKHLALEYVYLGRRFCMPGIKAGIF